jgi:hypothetical protein
MSPEQAIRVSRYLAPIVPGAHLVIDRTGAYSLVYGRVLASWECDWVAAAVRLVLGVPIHGPG